MNKNLKRIIGIGIGIIYLSSLTMECYLVDGIPSIGSFGLIAFLLGWLNFNLIGLIWLANPLFLLSLFLFFSSKKTKYALIFSLIASILAISFTQIDEIIKTEGGNTGKITEYLTGYWLWVSAIFLMLISSILDKILNKKTMHNTV
jgi:hypothetical protein